jgi:predicted lipid carrier protein YhbT
MNSQSQDSPALSQVLVAGMGLSVLLPALLQPLLDATLMVMRRRHSAMFVRLEAMKDTHFRIGPTDLPFDFLLSLGPAPTLKAVAKEVEDTGVTASIHGSLLTLMQLLEGKLDGDALFFSRDLVVDGDTEAVVMLRNIIDGAGIDIAEDIIWAVGPLAPPVKFASRRAGGVLRRMNRDFDQLKQALLAPAAAR